MSIMREFPRRPQLTGAIAPDSLIPARAMTAGLGLERADVVVELGATGAITEAMLRRLVPGRGWSRSERNAVLVRRLADRYRDSAVEVVHGSAEGLSMLTPRSVDVVVSALPWTVMPYERQRRTPDAVAGVPRTGGRSGTFDHVHAAWTSPALRFAAEPTARFSTVERGPVVRPDLPSAYEHRAVMPIHTPLLTPTRTLQHRSTP